MAEPQVRAAGGVIVRDGKVAVVHRPKHDDWSLPKGKLDDGESWEDAAVREVEEETGMRTRITGELDSAHYKDSKGRDKRVRWFRMDIIDDGAFEPSDEVDELRWVTPDEAARLLSYDHDRALVATNV